MRRKKRNNKSSWKDMVLFLLIILCIYFILALFDSSLAGEGGRNLGKYLRSSWGGALIVLLLFWLYLCIALLMEFRVPFLPRQVLGTLQLYVSFSFMLGLLREAGFNSEAVLFTPGAFGHGLAKFFVLNIGTFITLILVVGSFILSAYLYGSKILRVSLPEFPSLNPSGIMNMIRNREKTRKVRRRREREYPEDRPEQILFKREINLDAHDDTENLSNGDFSRDSDFYFDTVELPMFRNALVKNENESGHEEPEPERITEPQNPVEVFDNLLAILDTAPAPVKKKAEVSLPPRKIRRPLRTSSSYESESDSDSSQSNSKFPPPVELFGPAPKLEMNHDSPKPSNEQGNLIISTLKDFDVNASIAEIVEGASVIQYKLELSPGTKVSKISELDGELAMALAVMSVRIEAPIPGTRYAGIEVPKKDRKIITLRSIFESDEFRNCTSRLPLAMGVQTDGKALVHGLDEFPHIIITGSKGSGRSMFIHSCILSMCSVRRPDELKLILIDPRQSELSVYDGLPHLLASPVNDSDTAANALMWALIEAEKRTENFSKTKTRNLAAYNRKLPKDKRLPEIVIVINEFDDLLYSESGNEISDMIIQLAKKADTCGIHLVVSGRKYLIDIIVANIHVCAAFALSSKEDSEKILGVDDAVKLTGKGDMLFRNSGTSRLIRVQAPFISEERIADFTEYMNNSLGNPDLIDLN